MKGPNTIKRTCYGNVTSLTLLPCVALSGLYAFVVAQKFTALINSPASEPISIVRAICSVNGFHFSVVEVNEPFFCADNFRMDNEIIVGKLVSK